MDRDIVCNVKKTKTMKKLFTFTLILISFISCNDNDDFDLEYTNLKTIEIGNYEFEFPSNFKLVEKQGNDSYVGEVVGSGISLFFDFGYFTGGGPNINNPNNIYEVIEDNINNHIRQIHIAKAPSQNGTYIDFFAIDGYSEVINAYLSLSMGTGTLTIEEQELVVKILSSGKPIN